MSLGNGKGTGYDDSWDQVGRTQGTLCWFLLAGCGLSFAAGYPFSKISGPKQKIGMNDKGGRNGGKDGTNKGRAAKGITIAIK